MREVPVKNREKRAGVNKRENCRVNFVAWFLLLRRRFAVQMQLRIRSVSLSLPLSLSISLSRSLSLLIIIIYIHICAWQSADSRVTTDHCRVTLQWLFTKNFLIAWNVEKRCLTVVRRSRDLRPLSRDRSATFFKIFPNCLKRLKNVVWQSADGRVTSDHSRVTVQRLFSEKISNCLKRRKNVVWQSADGRVTSDHCRETVQWYFSNIFLIAWNVQKTWFDSRPTLACPLSRDCSVTFFKVFPNCLKLPKNVDWQSADGRVTSNHCRVTVRRLFSKFCFIAWNVGKTSFKSQRTVAWLSDYFTSVFLRTAHIR